MLVLEMWLGIASALGLTVAAYEPASKRQIDGGGADNVDAYKDYIAMMWARSTTTAMAAV